MKSEIQTRGSVRVTIPGKDTGVFFNKFALKQSIKNSGALLQIRTDNTWSSEPPEGKTAVEEKRILFPGIAEFSTARDTYSAWTDLEVLQTQDRTSDQPREKPERPEAIFERLLEARKTGTPVTLFVPWGARPTGSFGESEITVLNRLANLKEMLLRRKISSSLLLMPADLYATEINNQVASEQADSYFRTVTEEAEIRGFTAIPWSAIRQAHIELYTQRSSELTTENIQKLLSANKIVKAFDAAGRRSGYTERTKIQNAAFAYLRERICEAEMIESIYAPIKVSVVPKNKDNEVDRNLPRVYLIPPAVQLPWLK